MASRDEEGVELDFPHGLICGECDRVLVMPGEQVDPTNPDKQPWVRVNPRWSGEPMAHVLLCMDCWLRQPEVPPDVTGGANGVA